MIELVYIMAKSKWGRQVVKGLSEAYRRIGKFQVCAVKSGIAARAEGGSLDFYTKMQSNFRLR